MDVVLGVCVDFKGGPCKNMHISTLGLFANTYPRCVCVCVCLCVLLRVSGGGS